MLNKVILAVALILGSTAALAGEKLTDSNLQVTWVGQDSADAYALTGEYVADNNFFVGGGYAWGDNMYGDLSAYNFNMGAYVPIEKDGMDGYLYGKIGVGYTFVDNDWENYSAVGASASLIYENTHVRTSLGVVAEFADIIDGYGIASYNIVGALGYKFNPTWEAGTNFSLGDADTYGAYVRYNFL